jgi:hypothetical protein
MLKKPDLITVILDKSGSMKAIEAATLSGLNEFIEAQLRAGTPTRWTLTLFDTRVTAAFTGIPGEELQPLTRADYRPSGMTALHDAVALTLREMERQIEAGVIEHEGVVVVILTDGLENASSRYTMRDVAGLITRAEDRGWQFIFLGADQDSWAVGRGLGIAKGAFVDFAAAPASVDRAFKSAGRMTTNYRASKVVRSEYQDERGDE